MYETLKDLKAAYDSGAVPRDEALTIDNDTTSVYVPKGDDEDDYDEVFEMHPGTLLEQALDLLGIPWDHV
jgi:hypothetical protein